MAIAKRVFLFLLTNILVVVTISFILNLLGFTGYQQYVPGQGFQIDPTSLALFCLVWGMGGSLISLLISKQMAKWTMSVQIIKPERAGPAEQYIVQAVHRLAKAAGISKMPEVGIYNSPDVNAFATGPTKNRALVAVSTGLLQRMNKDEVEGVLGHEVAHIANGDMVTLTLIQGVVNAFVMFFARILASVVSSAISRNDDEGPGFIHFALVMVFEIAFGLLGLIVVSYFSRAREFRADAGSAKLGGRPKMIAALQALKSTVDRIPADQNAFSSLKISNKPGGFLSLISTHPPLEERIKRLQMMTSV